MQATPEEKRGNSYVRKKGIFKCFTKCSKTKTECRSICTSVPHASICTGPETDECDKVGGTAPRSEGWCAMVLRMRGRRLGT